MTRRFIGYITALITVASVGFYVASIDPETGFPDPITVDGRTIEFTWTDDNAGEDFRIYTDKATYTNGLSHAEVYVAVQNISGIEQDVELMAYFRDNQKRVGDVDVLEVIAETEATTEQFEVCEETDTGSSSTVCRMENGTSTVTVSTSTRRVDVPLIGRDANEVRKENDRIKGNPAARKPVENFSAARKTQGINIPADGVLYYKVLIEFPPNGDDNFYFEAIGERGSYGHLR